MHRNTSPAVDDYLAGLPDDRRETIARVREVVRVNLPDGYEEVVRWGMISFEVPLSRYPGTYNGQPLLYAALASQKNHCSLYLTAVYQDERRRAELVDAIRAAGMRPNMGKSCVRFRKVEDLPLEAIGRLIAAVPVEEFLATYERSRRGGGKGTPD